MKIEYKKELHPLLETLGLIYLMKNFEAVKEEMIGALEDRKIGGESFYKKRLSYLERYVNAFSEQYVSDELEDFFFEYRTDFFQIVLAVAVEYPEWETSIDELSQNEILEMMMRLFAGDGGKACELPDTMEKQFLLVQTMDYSEEVKWKLLTLLNDPQEKFQALFRIYRKNKQAFLHAAEKNREELQYFIEKDSGDITCVMEKLTHSFVGEETVVYPTAIFPLTEWLTSSIIFHGILVNELDIYKSGLSDAGELLPSLLKVLGDKSKFEILCSLKGKSKYNLEIAKEQNLTPATASHHMSTLLSNDFVTVEKKEGRVYYCLNQDGIRKIIELMEEILL